MVKIKLNDMSTAPKDGTRIIIFWYDSEMDLRNYNVREARWWTPTTEYQIKGGCVPHWEYINDNDFCATIKNPCGWIYKPDLDI